MSLHKYEKVAQIFWKCVVWRDQLKPQTAIQLLCGDLPNPCTNPAASVELEEELLNLLAACIGETPVLADNTEPAFFQNP